MRQAARLDRTGLLGWLGPDRAVAVVVASIVLSASVVSVAAATPGGPTGGTDGGGTAPRLAIMDGGGLEGDDQLDGTDEGMDISGLAGPFGPVEVGAGPVAVDLAADIPVSEAGISGPFLDDGTLLKPVAVDTTVEDGRGLLKKYRVRGGDTLSGIAARFDVSMMTLWWANKLDSKDELHLGQVLVIPPVSGLVVTVTPADTLDSLAAKYGVSRARILKTNQLTDPHLVVGQVLVVPGAKGKPIPTPKPTKAPAVSHRRTGGGGSARPPAHYGGGRFMWPVVGGGNQISQFYHYGHYAIDIAADYGSRVRAAGSGTVIFAGWKSNGGGYQVWIAHGSNLYTTYNHMSAVLVGRGQHVGRGQQVGRVGQSGMATGPHLHFEVWIGPVWNGGRRVNPLAYL